MFLIHSSFTTDSIFKFMGNERRFLARAKPDCDCLRVGQ